MKHEKLIKALNKIGLEVKKSSYNERAFECRNGVIICEWFNTTYDADKASCVCIRRVNDEHDSRSDYHAGSFYHTIKSIIERMMEGK